MSVTGSSVSVAGRTLKAGACRVMAHRKIGRHRVGFSGRMALVCLRTQPAASKSQRLMLASFELTWIHTCYTAYIVENPR